MPAKIAMRKKSLPAQFLQRSAGLIRSAANDYITEAMPVVTSSIAESKDMVSTIGEKLGASRNIVKNINNLKANANMRSLMTWFLQEENSFSMDSNFENDLTFDVEVDDNDSGAAIQELQISEAAKSANKISESLLRSSHQQVESQIVMTADIKASMEAQTAVIASGFDRTNETLNKILEVLTKNTSTMIEATVAGFTGGSNATTRMLQSGRFNLNEYKNIIRENVRRDPELGMLSAFGGMAKNGGLKQMLTPESLTSMLFSGVVNKAAPNLQKNLKALDNAVSDTIVQSLIRLSDDSKKNGSVLGRIFGIDPSMKNTNTSRLELRPATFDVMTHDAITLAIPGYLREILKSVGGKDLEFDYRTRRFKTSAGGSIGGGSADTSRARLQFAPGKGFKDDFKSLGNAILAGDPTDVTIAFNSIIGDTIKSVKPKLKAGLNKLSDSFGNIGGYITHIFTGKGYEYKDGDRIVHIQDNEKKGVFGFVKDYVHEMFAGTKDKAKNWFQSVSKYFDYSDSNISGEKEKPSVASRRKKIISASVGALAGSGILGGPVGLIMGALAGSAISSIDGIGAKIKDLLIGRDEKGKPKGLITRAMDGIIDPLKFQIAKTADHVGNVLKKNILGPLSDIGFAIKERVTHSAETHFGKAFKFIGNVLTAPFKAITKVASWPIKMLGGAVRAGASGVGGTAGFFMERMADIIAPDKESRQRRRERTRERNRTIESEKSTDFKDYKTWREKERARRAKYGAQFHEYIEEKEAAADTAANTESIASDISDLTKHALKEGSIFTHDKGMHDRLDKIIDLLREGGSMRVEEGSAGGGSRRAQVIKRDRKQDRSAAYESYDDDHFVNAAVTAAAVISTEGDITTDDERLANQIFTEAAKPHSNDSVVHRKLVELMQIQKEKYGSGGGEEKKSPWEKLKDLLSNLLGGKGLLGGLGNLAKLLAAILGLLGGLKGNLTSNVQDALGQLKDAATSDDPVTNGVNAVLNLFDTEVKDKWSLPNPAANVYHNDEDAGGQPIQNHNATHAKRQYQFGSTATQTVTKPTEVHPSDVGKKVIKGFAQTGILTALSTGVGVLVKNVAEQVIGIEEDRAEEISNVATAGTASGLLVNQLLTKWHNWWVDKTGKGKIKNSVIDTCLNFLKKMLTWMADHVPAIGKLAQKLKDVTKWFDDIYERVVTKITTEIAEKVNKALGLGAGKGLTAAATGTVLATAFGAVTGGVHGFATVATLFRVMEPDVDNTMRIVSTAINAVLGALEWFPYTSNGTAAFEIIDSAIFQGIFNKSLLQMLADFLYNLCKGDGGKTLKEKQGKLEAERQYYNEKYGKDLNIQAFNDLVNSGGVGDNIWTGGSAEIDVDGHYIFDEAGGQKAGGISGAIFGEKREYAKNAKGETIYNSEGNAVVARDKYGNEIRDNDGPFAFVGKAINKVKRIIFGGKTYKVDQQGKAKVDEETGEYVEDTGKEEKNLIGKTSDLIKRIANGVQESADNFKESYDKNIKEQEKDAEAKSKETSKEIGENWNTVLKNTDETLSNVLNAFNTPLKFLFQWGTKQNQTLNNGLSKLQITSNTNSLMNSLSNTSSTLSSFTSGSSTGTLTSSGNTFTPITTGSTGTSLSTSTTSSASTVGGMGGPDVDETPVAMSKATSAMNELLTNVQNVGSTTTNAILGTGAAISTASRNGSGYASSGVSTGGIQSGLVMTGSGSVSGMTPGQAVCNACEQMEAQLQADKKQGLRWEYHNTDAYYKTVINGDCPPYIDCVKNGIRGCNCAQLAGWALQGGGILPARGISGWYGSKGGGLTFCGNTRPFMEAGCKIMHIQTKTVKELVASGELQPGDCVTYVELGHTNVYGGGDLWYDGGHLNCHPCSGEGAVFERFKVHTHFYDNNHVGNIIRPMRILYPAGFYSSVDGTSGHVGDPNPGYNRQRYKIFGSPNDAGASIGVGTSGYAPAGDAYRGLDKNTFVGNPGGGTISTGSMSALSFSSSSGNGSTSGNVSGNTLTNRLLTGGLGGPNPDEEPVNIGEDPKMPMDENQQKIALSNQTWGGGIGPMPTTSVPVTDTGTGSKNGWTNTLPKADQGVLYEKEKKEAQDRATTLNKQNLEAEGGNPLNKPYKITSGFGQRSYPKKEFHYGIDLVPLNGTTTADVGSRFNGRISYVKNDVPDSDTARLRGRVYEYIGHNSAGNQVWIDTSTGMRIKMMHLKAGSIPSYVHQGATIHMGYKVGEMGSTGWSTAPHLHYQMEYNTTGGNQAAFDPSKSISSHGTITSFSSPLGDYHPTWNPDAGNTDSSSTDTGLSTDSSYDTSSAMNAAQTGTLTSTATTGVESGVIAKLMSQLTNIGTAYMNLVSGGLWSLAGGLSGAASSTALNSEGMTDMVNGTLSSGSALQTFLEMCQAEVGTKENGTNNVKYNTWYYGHEVSGSAYPWCMVFVQWCFDHAGMKLPVKTAHCGYFLNWYKQNKPSAVTNTPQPGDIAIWGNGSHTGIVKEVNGSQIVTIEGNSGNQVANRTKSASAATAYVRPVDWAAIDAAAGTSTVNGALPTSKYEPSADWAKYVNNVVEGDTGSLWQFFINVGFTDIMISGICGCWQAESNIRPKRLEWDYLVTGFNQYLGGSYDRAATDRAAVDAYTQWGWTHRDDYNKPAYKGPDGHLYCGYGLGQWTGPRGYNLLGFANKLGKKWYDISVQLLMMHAENNESGQHYSQWESKLAQASSPEDAALNFCKHFEGYGGNEGRTDHARNLYNQYAGKYHKQSSLTSTSGSLLSTIGAGAGGPVGNAIIEACEKFQAQLEADKAAGRQWEYHNPSKFCEEVWENALAKNKRGCNCALLARWALKEAGVIPNNTGNFYGQLGGGIRWGGNSESIVKQYCQDISIQNKTVNELLSSGQLKAGDIVTYVDIQHTNIYGGGSVWYDAGHANCIGSGEGAVFRTWKGTGHYGNYKVGHIIRAKSLATTSTGSNFSIKKPGQLFSSSVLKTLKSTMGKDASTGGTGGPNTNESSGRLGVASNKSLMAMRAASGFGSGVGGARGIGRGSGRSGSSINYGSAHGSSVGAAGGVGGPSGKSAGSHSNSSLKPGSYGWLTRNTPSKSASTVLPKITSASAPGTSGLSYSPSYTTSTSYSPAYSGSGVTMGSTNQQAIISYMAKIIEILAQIYDSEEEGNDLLGAINDKDFQDTGLRKSLEAAGKVMSKSTTPRNRPKESQSTSRSVASLARG